MPRLGLDVPGELDTLAERLRDDAVANGTGMFTRPAELVDAFLDAAVRPAARHT